MAQLMLIGLLCVLTGYWIRDDFYAWREKFDRKHGIER